MHKLWWGTLAGAGVAASAYGFLWWLPTIPVQPPARPARNLDEAMARLRQLQAEDGPNIHPVCRTQLLTHAAPTQRVVMLYHGFTNCPHQYQELAAQLHAAGDTVFIPRLPLHGQTDQRPANLGTLKAPQVVEFVQRTVDIACGLAPEVVVMGFSFGGILAGWVAQHRSEVKRVVLVSPAFGFRAVPNRRLYAAILPRLPDQFMWWDPELKERTPVPQHAYLGYPRRGAGLLLRMGLAVEQAARSTPPRVRSIAVMVNPSDELLDNQIVLRLAETWRQHGAAVEIHSFDAADKLDHDLIDPLHHKQKVERVYPLVKQVLAAPHAL